MKLASVAVARRERDRMRAFAMVSCAELKGRRGTMRLVRSVDLVDVPRGLQVRTGTWRIVRGTGQYAGLEGGGRFAGVFVPDRRLLVREEGWVAK